MFAAGLKKGGMLALCLEGFTLIAGSSIRSILDVEK